MTWNERLSHSQRALHGLWQRIAHRWATWRSHADRTSETAYLAQLAAPEPGQRWRAAAGLGRNPVRSPEAIQALIVALADPEQFVRWHAAEALAAQESSRVFAALVSTLNDHNPFRRAAAAEALGCLGGEAATQVLRRHLGDSDPHMRTAVASALGQTKDPTISAHLVPLLADHDPEVVRAVATALGRLGDAASAVPLAQTLVQPRQPLLVRRALAAALVHAPHPDAQPNLLAALNDPDPQVRGYAARALGHVGDEAAHVPLEALRADRNRLLRGTVGDRAARALALLERRGRRALVPGKPGEED